MSGPKATFRTTWDKAGMEQFRAAEEDCRRMMEAAKSVGATVVQDEIQFTPAQYLEFCKLMVVADAPK